MPPSPPAFPVNAVGAEAPHSLPPASGMTLRDYFAAQVLPVLVANGDFTEQFLAGRSTAAYRVADAMLAARGTA